MQRTEARQRAESFRGLHRGPTPLVLVNAWDAASAAILQEAGSLAIATSSAGIAWSLGFADGEQLPAGELIAACERVCRVVSIPVSVDIEQGFGNLAEMSALARALVDMGVIGLNIEDGIQPETGKLMPAAILCERIQVLRDLFDELQAMVFINARTDAYLVANEAFDACLEVALARATLYAAAGADGVFVPGVASAAEISRLASSVQIPLNVYAGYEQAPDVAFFKRAGARRVSLGCGPMQTTLGLLRRIARSALGEGDFRTMQASMVPVQEVNNLFIRPK